MLDIDIQQTTQLYLQIATITENDKGIGNPETTAIYRDIGQTQWRTVKFLLGKGVHIQSGDPRSEGTVSGEVFVNAHVRVAQA